MKSATLLLLLSVFTAFSALAAPAPMPEATVNDFFTYLLSPKNHIVKDAASQKRWLTEKVRHSLMTADAAADKASKAHPNEQVDGPDNGTFLAAWDPPTSFKILGTKTKDTTASVDLLFTWGPKAQYAGETRKMTVLLTQEGGTWRISDIQSHAAKFNKASTLLGDLHDLAKQH